MGLLPDQYPRADFGNELNGGFGFIDLNSVMMTIDADNPNIGCTYLVAGNVYKLKEGLEFERVEE